MFGEDSPHWVVCESQACANVQTSKFKHVDVVASNNRDVEYVLCEECNACLTIGDDCDQKKCLWTSFIIKALENKDLHYINGDRK